MLIASRSCQPRGAGRLARRQAAGIAQGTLIAAGSPPFPLRASILRWNRSDEAKLYSVRPDTWQPRIASNCAGAHRFERRPSRMAFRLVDPPGSSRRFCPPPRRGLRILAGARYRWLCAREDRCRGVAKTLRSRWRCASGAFAPIVEDGRPQLHPAGRSSFTFAELDRETQTSLARRTVPR